MALLHFLALCMGLASARAAPSHSATGRPQASVTNGTVEGVRLEAFGVDAFLGIPFAQPPQGNNRFRHPQPYNTSWTSVRDASQYSPACPGYAGFSTNLTLSENCLTLNVIRPVGTYTHGELPVLVWIYGGGFTGGGTSDPRYNLTSLVNASASINQPIIAVSMNYRLGSWGFLAAKEVTEKNFGLYDQRLALRWIQENIAGFGGDPSKVTIWGESAGAFSAGFHTIAYDGKNDGLFRAAILESGTALAPGIESSFADSYQPMYDNITAMVGCSNKPDSLQCLRDAPYEAIFEASRPFVFTPVIDGQIIPRLPSESFKLGLVANVSILAGSNTDEGTAVFWGPRGTLNTTIDVRNYVSKLGVGLPDCIVDNILSLYPDIPSQGCPFNTGDERFASQGQQYKRGAAIAGDMAVHAGRRQTTEYFSSLPDQHRPAVYAYRFDQPPWNNVEELIATVAPVYATHYAEIGFVFNNSYPGLTTWIGPDPHFHDLSGLMSKSWISFAHSLDPNKHGVPNIPEWPEYHQGKELMVFRANEMRIEKDDWRTPQLAYWKLIWKLVKT